MKKLQNEDRVEHLTDEDFISMMNSYEIMKNDFKESKEWDKAPF